MIIEDRVDSTDLKILETLTKDARTNLSKIAEECGLSSSAILKRIENLKAAGIIVGTQLNLKRGALGYPYEATVGIIAENSRIEQVAEAIRSQPNVIVCTKSIGRFNMLCMVLAQSTNELDKATQNIKNILGVKGIAINIWIDEPYFEFIKSDQQPVIDEILDETDVLIIKELLKDSRVSFTKIANKIKVSHETVRKKYEKMKKSGTITSSSIVVDWSKLGYQGNVFLFISQSQGNSKSITINALKKIPSVYLITKVMGTFDILACTMVKDLRDFAKIVDEIQKIPSVEHIEVCFATFTYFSFAPIPRSPIKCDRLELS
jgi:DNA-binding Lrp family transcriptional regulator